MKTLFVTKSELDPATRYRVWPLAARLKDLGHQVELISSKKLLVQILVKVKQADITIIQRKLFSSPVIRIISGLSKSLIFDLDDAIFLRSSGEVSSSRGKRFQTIASSCDYIWAGNDFLASRARNYCNKVQLVPTPVDTRRYGLNVERESVFTLVWIGSSSTRKYLESHRQALEQIGRSIEEIQLKVISDFEFSLDHLKVINRPWSEGSEIAELKSSHLGIAPMVENPWTRGKCALKVIQYMAASLPVISSPVGANAEVVIDGVTGILAADASQWVSGVEMLYRSETLRAEMAEKGRLRVEEFYSQNVVVEKLVRTLELS